MAYPLYTYAIICMHVEREREREREGILLAVCLDGAYYCHCLIVLQSLGTKLHQAFQ